MTRHEPRSAADYDDRITAAVKAVLIEIGQILGSYKGKFALIGGAVPSLLLDHSDMSHIGTLDIDLGLNAEALGEGEYARLIEALQAKGYERRDGLRRFQLVRRLPAESDSTPIDIIVDFLMPRDASIAKNVPPLLDDFAVQRADGVDLAFRFYELVSISGPMPGGGTNRVEIAVCSIPALLAMKGHALNGRLKQKDAYDIYYCIRNYPGGAEELGAACRRLRDHPSARAGYQYIAEKFETIDSYGPTCVRQFVDGTAVLGDRTADQWQQDAFGQVDVWLRVLGLNEPA